MNSRELGYFPDLKKFVEFFKNYIYLFISIVILTSAISLFLYNQDINNIEIKENSKIVIKKKINDSFNFLKVNYENNTQLNPITNYTDIHDYVFKKINSSFENLFNKNNVEFTHILDGDDLSIFTTKNFEIDPNFGSNLYIDIFKDFNYFKKNYKEVEFQKLNKRIIKFFIDISSNSLNLKEIYSSELINDSQTITLEILEKKLYELSENILDKSYFNEKLSDENIIFQNKFNKSIYFYLFNFCNKSNELDNFCLYIEKNEFYSEFNKFNLENTCELASNNIDFKRIILTIIDNKIVCPHGYHVSDKILFSPLKNFLDLINFYEGLYDIEITVEKEMIQPSLIIYILYTLAFSIFLFIILSNLHSLLKSSK